MECESSGTAKNQHIAVLQFGTHRWVGTTLAANLEGNR